MANWSSCPQRQHDSASPPAPAPDEESKDAAADPLAGVEGEEEAPYAPGVVEEDEDAALVARS